LWITNIDIQSLEPIDTKTRDILNGSMKLSMETNIKIQEAEAKHRENRSNQEAFSRVQRKQIEDETESEEKRLTLLKLKAENETITITGKAESTSKAISQENEINSLGDLERAKNQFEADKIRRTSELERINKEYKEEIEHITRMSKLEVDKAELQADSSIEKIETMVKAIGKDTLVELARAGPEGQAKILKGLGVKSLLVTDGKNPINLFNTSCGLLGGMNTTSTTNNQIGN